MAPVSVGVAVVSVISPAAFASTRIPMSSTSWRRELRASTRRRWVDAAASLGTLTSNRTVPGLPGPAVDTVDDEAATEERRSPTGGYGRHGERHIGRLVGATVRSKLTFDPGATATAEYGVVTSSPFAAAAAGTNAVSITVPAASTVVARMRKARAIRA